MRRFTSAILASLILVAPAAEAGYFDRPDLQDLNLREGLHATPGTGSTYSVTARFQDPAISYTYRNTPTSTITVYYLLNATTTIFPPYPAAAYFDATIRRTETTPSGVGVATFFLYEPDKIIRKAKIQLMKQSAHVAMIFYGYTGANLVGGYLNGFNFNYDFAPPVRYEGNPDCSAQVKAKDSDLNGSYETTIWIAICKKAAIDTLSLTDAQRTTLKNLFGSKNVVKASGKLP